MSTTLATGTTKDAGLPVSLIERPAQGWEVSMMLPTGRRTVRSFGCYRPALEHYEAVAKPS